MAITSPSLTPQTTLAQVLELCPGAQRALFRRYHIGGCSSCAFQPAETLEQLCRRNDNIDVQEMIDHILRSHHLDEALWIDPPEVAALLQSPSPPILLDVRTREEWDAVHIAEAVRMTQESLQEILGRWPREALIVVCDHQGKQSLDAAAYFEGHGFTNVRCLRGGIDAWSQAVDPKLPRYELA